MWWECNPYNITHVQILVTEGSSLLVFCSSLHLYMWCVHSLWHLSDFKGSNKTQTGHSLVFLAGGVFPIECYRPIADRITCMPLSQSQSLSANKPLWLAIECTLHWSKSYELPLEDKTPSKHVCGLWTWGFTGLQPITAVILIFYSIKHLRLYTHINLEVFFIIYYQKGDRSKSRGL